MSKCNPIVNCKDGYYRCPSCSKCYCKHTYSEINYTWTCPNGKILSCGQHIMLHSKH